MVYVLIIGVFNIINLFIVPHTVTIFNIEVLENGTEIHSTIIENVRWQDISFNDLRYVTQVINDKIKVIIPKSSVNKPFIPYNEWLELDDKSTHWTLSEFTWLAFGKVLEKSGGAGGGAGGDRVRSYTLTEQDTITADFTSLQSLKETANIFKMTKNEYYSLSGIEHWVLFAK